MYLVGIEIAEAVTECVVSPCQLVSTIDINASSPDQYQQYCRTPSSNCSQCDTNTGAKKLCTSQ